MRTLQHKDIGDYRYEVDYDDSGYHSYFNDMDCFETVEEKEAYKAKFHREELAFYIVTLKKKCHCCSNYEFVDALCGIVAETEEEALNQYIDDYGVNP